MLTACSEIYHSWSGKFRPYGINVAMATSEPIPENISLESLVDYQIIIATYEKWEIMTRRSHAITHSIRLMCIDDIDLIDDFERGPGFETMIMRTKYFQSNIRYIAASSTVPNIDDVAQWFHSLNPNYEGIALQ